MIPARFSRDVVASNHAHVALVRCTSSTPPLVVDNYDDAIRFFVDALGFDLVEDSAGDQNDGRPSGRGLWSDPRKAQTGLLLAEAEGEQQVDAIGHQYAVELVCSSGSTTSMQLGGGCSIMASSSSPEPRDEPYGRVAVFLDLSGNRWIYLDRGPRD